MNKMCMKTNLTSFVVCSTRFFLLTRNIYEGDAQYPAGSVHRDLDLVDLSGLGRRRGHTRDVGVPGDHVTCQAAQCDRGVGAGVQV